MSVWILLIEALSVGGAVAFINHYYGDWHKQHIGVTIASFLSWYLPLLIVCVLPIDISVTFYHRCLEKANHSVSPIASHANDTLLMKSGTSITQECREPWIYLDPLMMMYFWRVVYWTSQFLTWLLLPMIQSFAKTGNFTVLGKLKAALLDNVIYYGTYLIIFSIIFTYVVFRGDINLNPANLKVTVISAANTWGLFLVIIFLGYGLVQVPRVVMHAADPELSLRQAYFQLSKASMEKAEYEEELEDCLKDVQNYDKSISPSHYLRDKMMIVVQKSHEVIPERWSEIQSRIPAVPVDKVLSEKDLIYLHRRLKLCQQRYTRTQALWQSSVQSALWLESLESNRGSRLRQFRPIHSSNEEDGSVIPVGAASLICNPTVEWYWKCALRPIFLKGLAYCLICISVAVVWSECTFFVKSPPLSIYAAILQAAARNYNFLTISLISFVTIGYLCFATYYTVFHLRIFNYFQLVGNHLSDENSMIFCGMLLCRLTPPLCLNFLGLVHMDSHVMRSENDTGMESASEAAYTRIMGHLDVIPFISRGFNVYFPMVVLVLCLATLMRLGTRCLHAMGLEQFLSSSDEFTQDAVEEGRILLRREKLVSSRRNAPRRGESGAGMGFSKNNSSGVETRTFTRAVLPEENVTSQPSDEGSYQSTDTRTALNLGSRYGRNAGSSDDRVQLLAAEENGDDSLQPSRLSLQNSPARSVERNLLDWTPVEYNADAMDQYLDSSVGVVPTSTDMKNNSNRGRPADNSHLNERLGFRNLFN